MRKGGESLTCESAFRLAGVGLCRTQAKVASRLSNVYVAALSMRKMRKGDVTNVECKMWSVKCEVWSGECEV